MRRRRVRIGSKTLTLPVAVTDDEKSKGLSGITELGRDDGMVFEYDRDVRHGFWMKDTHVALDIAFVDSSGHIFQVSSMVPEDEGTIKPSKPYRWAVEMPSGWFDRNLGGKASCDLRGDDT